MKMKAVACILLIALLANMAVEARRELESVARASTRLSTNTRSRSGSPTTVSEKKVSYSKSSKKKHSKTPKKATPAVDAPRDSDPLPQKSGSSQASTQEFVSAKDCGVHASVSIVARNGESVSIEKHASRKGCGDVKETTIVKRSKGKHNKDKSYKKSMGKYGTSKNKWNGEINLAIFIGMIKNGENAEDVAIIAVKEFQKFENRDVASALIYLANNRVTFDLFDACVELLFEARGCKGFRRLIKGFEKQFILVQLPFEVVKCVYTSCSLYPGAQLCCSESQLAKDHCSCKDGKCGWGHPLDRQGSIPFWICEDCGLNVPACTCD